MSIAVSAIIAPSRLLRAAVAVFAAAQFAAGLVLARGAIASPWPQAGLAAACLLAGAALALQAARPQKARRIDISGLGEIRVTVQQQGGASTAPLLLLPASTLWPQLLLLLLRGEDGVTVLAVTPDSVAPAAFRALAVALRFIAGRDNKFFKNNKIV
jgi:toxin CptA